MSSPWTQKSQLYLKPLIEAGLYRHESYVSRVSRVVTYGAASTTSSTHLMALTILYLSSSLNTGVPEIQHCQQEEEEEDPDLVFGDLLVSVYPHYQVISHSLGLEILSVVTVLSASQLTCLRELAWPKWTMS